MSKAIVTLTNCNDYDNRKVADCLNRHFELLGGVENFVKKGDHVLLKPNFIAPKPRAQATQTDPVILIETAKILKDYGAKPFIADSPAWSNVFECVKILGMEEDLKRLDVPVKQLDNPKPCKIGKYTRIGISSVALDADVIINMPKFKSHQQLVATFAVKNMFGTVSGKKKAYWHYAKGKKEESFCKMLIGIYDFLKPVLTIIDGVIAMDGPGPINGRARPLGYIIAGTEPIACEIVCAKLINLDPFQLPIVRTAGLHKFGCTDAKNIEILGDGFPSNVCNNFILPNLIPIRFSLLHVCKSIGKQILLLSRGKSAKNEL